MSSQLDKVFTADPKSVYELFLSKGTVGFYIPAYQREYSWDEDNIFRLMEDICSGISSYAEHSDAITFIGTVISILDTDHHTIKPYIHGELPSEVMSVIDGQQRLTTLTLLATCLYQKLSSITHDLKKFPSHIKGWIGNEINPILARLRQVLEIDRYTDNPIYRYYPKLTRAYLDQWSTIKDSAFYNSPIASYLFGFQKHYHAAENDSPKAVYKHVINESVEESDLPKHQRVLDNVKAINKKLDLVTKKEGDETYRYPLISDVLADIDVQSRLLGRQVNDSWIEEIKAVGDKEWKTFEYILRLLIFVKFYLDRIAVTSVVATNETYAFDMFEALNTTGEPLTAFETFKPKVIDLEDIKNYEESSSRSYIDHIDKSLDKYRKAEDKQDATTRLLQPFRLAFEGESLSKHLSDQRRFLNKAFDSLTSNGDKRGFVKNLYEMSLFLKECWPEKKVEMPLGEVFSEYNCEEVLLQLDMLREANHHIVLGVLFRYFSKYLNSERNTSDFNEFAEAVKVVTSFFVLWRATRQGTDSIDAVYREILKNGFTENETLICRPICLKHTELSELPSVNDLRKGFKGYLDKKTLKPLVKSSFVDKAKNILTYRNNRSLTRYMLLIASNDVVASDTELGLVQTGVVGSAPNYNMTRWREYRTIEHIFPQNSSTGWNEDLTQLASEHVIGNLLLLPGYINSSLGNKSWQEKKLIFSLLCSKTNGERNQYINEAQSERIELPFSTEKIAINASYMSHVEAGFKSGRMVYGYR